MPEHTNIISVDSSAAQAALAALNQALLQHGTAINKVISESTKYNKAGEVVGMTLKGLTEDNRKIGASFQKAGKEMTMVSATMNHMNQALTPLNQQSKSLLLSWRSMARIFAVQQLHRLISGVTGAFRESISEAQKFQIRISEIRTIAGNSQRTFDEWTTSTRNLANEFGKGVIDVAEAQYQALSNQVANSRAEFDLFMESAMAFSRVAVTTSAQSVSLLSSALNSYEMDAARASEVSAGLFKIIELGRIRGEDMADTFGTIARPAKQLGVDFAELGGALTTLTRSGLRSHNAFTLINALMLKLIKPTEAMKKQLQEWGYSTGQQLIAAEGMAGLLERISNAAQGDLEVFGELAGRLRAIRAVMGLTGGAMGEFLKDTEAIRQAMQEQENIQEGLVIAFESTGARLQREIERIKNFFVVEIGQELTDAIVGFTEPLGGLSNLITGFIRGLVELTKFAVNMGVAFVGVKFTLSAYAVITGTSAAATSSLTTALLALHTAMGPIGWTALAIAGALAAIKFAYDNMETPESNYIRRQQEIKAREAERTEQLKELTKQLSEQRKEVEKLATQITSTLAKAQQQSVLKMRDSIKASREAYEEQAKLVAESQTKLVALIDEQIRETQRTINEAERNIDDAAKLVNQVKREFREGLFERQFDAAKALGGRAGYARQLRLIREELKRVEDAQTESLKAGDFQEAKKNYDQLNEILDKRQDLLNQNALTGISINTRTLMSLRIEKERAKYEEQFTKAIQKRAEETLKEQEALKLRLSEEKLAKKELLDTYKSMVKMKLDETAFDPKKAAELTSAYKTSLLNILDKVNLDTASKEFLPIIDSMIKSMEEYSGKIDKLQQAENAFKRIDIINKGLAERHSALADNTAQWSEQLSQVQSRYEGVFNLINLVSEKMHELDPAHVGAPSEPRYTQDQLNRAEAMWEKQRKFTEAVKEGNIELARDQLDGFMSFAEALGQGSNSIRHALEELHAQMGLETLLDLGTLYEQEAKQYADLREKQAQAKVDLDIIVEQQKVLVGMVQKDYPEAFEEVKRHAASIGPELEKGLKESRPGAEAQIEAMRAGMLRLLEVTKQVRLEQARVVAGEGHAIGGFATGGRNPLDRRLGWFRDGEFFVRPEAARAFYPEIVALNAGIRPGFATGGPANISNSTTIGDVNVTVTGSGNSEIDGRRIANAIRRELRRGTVRM